MKNKKPTMMEVKQAIGELINRTNELNYQLKRTQFTFSEFIEFKKDNDEFTKYLEKKLKEQEEKNEESLAKQQGNTKSAEKV